MQHFQPVFFFQHAQDVKRIVFVGQLLDLVSDCPIGDVFDVVVLSRRIESLLCSFFERPVKTGSKAGGTDESRWIFDKSVIVQNAKQLGFNIRCAIERVH